MYQLCEQYCGKVDPTNLIIEIFGGLYSNILGLLNRV